MDHLKRRWLAAALALCMVLGLLAGCGSKDKDAQQLSAMVYVPKYIDLGVKLDDIGSSCTDEENIYLVGETEVRTEHRVPGYDTGEDEVYYDYTYVYDIYRVPLDGGAAEKLPNYTAPSVPEGYEGHAYIDSISAGDDGTLWVTESVYVWGRTSEKYGDYDDGVAETLPEPRTMSASTADVAIDEPIWVDDDYEYEDFSDMNTSIRRHISADGTDLGSIDISSLEEKLEVEWLRDASFGPEGNIYTLTEDTLFVLDSDLNVLFTLELPTDSWPSLTALGSGQACINYWHYDEATETSGYKLTMIDCEKQDWGTEYLLPSSAYSIFPGGGDYLFYYQLNDAIFGWKKDAPEGTETGERLFAWIDADVNSDNIQNFYFLPDGRVAAVTREWKYDGNENHLNVGAVIMTATPRDQLPQKTTLTYATMYLNYNDRSRIIDFNKTSEKYRIEVKDYAEYNTASDSSAGLQKLNTEIIAGVVPDILCTDELPVKQYAARGYLEDLWPFIDNDPDLGRDKLMTKPLEADQVNGKLYEIFGSFAIQTAVGPSKIVGDRMSWTLADLQAALEKMPEGCAIFGEDDTKDGMLSTILYMNMESFVDWDSGKCYFDSDNFKSLLAFCNGFAAEYDYDNVDWDEWEDSDTRILTGKQLLSVCYLSNFSYSFRRNQVLFDGGPAYVGYPMEDGSVGSCFSLPTCYAISSTCKDKDGAWSYLRQVLLPSEEGEERYYYSGFSINKADFDKALEEAMTPEYMTDENGEIMMDEDGEPMTWGLGSLWLEDGTELPFHLPTQEEVDQVMALYNAITTVYRYDKSISDIVNDVAGGYFAGDKTLDETASLIQNRVNLYVNESK
ncbi:MAG: hypothetical protein K2N78_07930 [Oscillospiraceae bacterium]|nr:hypothetical protein [Oscillospiraceae bacterium]